MFYCKTIISASFFILRLVISTIEAVHATVGEEENGFHVDVEAISLLFNLMLGYQSIDDVVESAAQADVL